MEKPIKSLIILGAGASYDCIHPDVLNGVDDHVVKHRPPLINDLFNSHNFNKLIIQHTDLTNLPAVVQSGLRRDESFEEIITAEFKKGRKFKSFIAFLFYLRDLFLTISVYHHWPSDNNYAVLASKIDDFNNEFNAQTCILNYNYDTLFEQNHLILNNAKKMSDYLNGDIKLLKPHGSCNWLQMLPLNETYYQGDDIYKYLIDNPGFIEREDVKEILGNNIDQIRITTSRGSVYFEDSDSDRKYFLPGMLLPVLSKSPMLSSSAINTLLNTCAQVDRILIIGWRGVDPFLLNELNKAMKSRMPNSRLDLYVVGRENVDETVNNVTSAMKFANFSSKNLFKDGFSEYVNSDLFDNYFS